MFLLAEVPLAGALPLGALLVTEGEMEFVVPRFLEKRETILLESEILEEGKVLLFSCALLVIWYSWSFSSSFD